MTQDAVTDAVVAATLAVIQSRGPSALVVDDLRPDEVERIAWSGSPSHLRSVARVLERVPSGETEYLVVRAPTGEPVAKGGIDYTQQTGAGAIFQLATHEQLQG